MSLRFKPEVRIVCWNELEGYMLNALSEWSLLHKLDVQINSINDPAPGRVPDTDHKYDLAIDAEPIGNATADRQALANYCRKRLPVGFDVILEDSHVHLQFNLHRAPLQQMPG